MHKYINKPLSASHTHTHIHTHALHGACNPVEQLLARRGEVSGSA